jgi:hypothetical protein
MKCGPRQVNNSEWSYPTTALRRDSQLDAGATDSHRVLTADTEFAPHELGTDAIRCSVTSQALRNGRFRTRRSDHTTGAW